MKEKQDLGSLRKSYEKGGLSDREKTQNPMNLFARWFTEAEATPAIEEANAMSLVTQGLDGYPKARVVLLKHYDTEGFVFYTNYESGKAAALQVFSQASMLFPWNELDRQVTVTGSVSPVSDEESDAYFASRPRDSQLGAWASAQSRMIDSRAALLEQLAEVTARFGEGKIPRPSHWGGYRLVPIAWEFWQGGESRLHDRYRYTRTDDNSWLITRLQP